MNPNTFYAETFVDALARSGLQAVCIAPGSRSTPLTLAFAKHDGIKKYTHLDERSAAFFALGMAMASDKPVAMVCTSGTAAANFFPAIIEANMSRVPLLVLTADRPHELRHSGANQTIDQIKMYGDHVLWSVDMPLPEVNPPAVAVRNVRTMAARALATADGLRKGVVHLNFPFRKPLEPAKSNDNPQGNASSTQDSNLRVSNQVSLDINFFQDQFDEEDLERSFAEAETGLIICGPNCPRDPFFAGAVRWMSATTGFPLFADSASGIRFCNTESVLRQQADKRQAPIFGAFDYMPFDNFEAPQLVVRFGGVPTSNVLNRYLGQISPNEYILVNEHGDWHDDQHSVTWHYQASPTNFCLNAARSKNNRGENLNQFAEFEDFIWPIVDGEITKVLFDGAVVNRVIGHLPERANLLVGNSNAIRHIDQFVIPNPSDVAIYASRGASGIDGQVSTALGIGAATGQHVYAILGDITFYHDMNGLLAIQRNGVTATIIVINNNGGGIFERLPIREHEPYHTDYFLTPHGLTFEHAAALYGLQYAYADDFASLDAALEKYINADVSSIIEVKTDIKTDEARRREIIKTVNEQIRQRLSDSE